MTCMNQSGMKWKTSAVVTTIDLSLSLALSRLPQSWSSFLIVLIMTKYVLLLWRWLPLRRAEVVNVRCDYWGGEVTHIFFSSARLPVKVFADIAEKFVDALLPPCRVSVSTDQVWIRSRRRLVGIWGLWYTAHVWTKIYDCGQGPNICKK